MLFFFAMIVPCSAFTQDTVRTEIPPVVVTAARVPSSELGTSQPVQVIDDETVAAFRGSSIDDLLRANSALDLQSRGPSGIQTDIGMRGGLYSQSLVLVDGVRMNDPQTGHHTMDLPITLSQLDRVEIMQGPGSSLYGADAFGGTINLLTREPENNSMTLRIGTGEHGFVHTGASIDMVTQAVSSAVAFDYRKSAGYRYDTEFTDWNLNAREYFSLGSQRLSAMVGYTSKAFGAFDFYSPGLGIPSKEWTSTGFASLRTAIAIASVQIEPVVYYRRHNDKFMFDLRTPNLFVNTHHTDCYGGHVVVSSVLEQWLSAVGGWETDADAIGSSKLGSHKRSSNGLFISLRPEISGEIAMDLGMRADMNSSYGTFVSPSAGISVTPAPRWKVFAHFGKSFRAPSYTELYYSDPANVGNPNLKPETGWSTEAGTQAWIGTHGDGSLTWFLRREENLIDYAQFFAGDLYHAVNLSSATTSGFECAFALHGMGDGDGGTKLQSARVDYTFLQSAIDRKDAFNTKYALLHPRHQLLATARVEFPLGFSLQGSTTYRYVSWDSQWDLVDLQAGRSFSWGDVYFSVSNIFNVSYEEIPGVPRPGRWATGGVQVKL